MKCSEIWIHRDGTIRHDTRIELQDRGKGMAIPIGIGPRKHGTFVHLSLSAERQLMIPEQSGIESRDGHHYLTEAEVVNGGSGKPLLVKEWTASLIDDRIMILVHIESGNKGKVWLDPHPSGLIASGERWRKPELRLAYCGIIYEALLVLSPQQTLTWYRTGKHAKTTYGTIVYRGRGAPDRFLCTSLESVRKTG